MNLFEPKTQSCPGCRLLRAPFADSHRGHLHDDKGHRAGPTGQLLGACRSVRYARNYLLPRKLASEATADAINAIKLKEKAKAAQAAKEKAQAEEYAKKLDAVQVTVRAKAGNGGKLFGAVTSEAISKARRAG